MINQKLIEIVTKPFNKDVAQALKAEIENQYPTIDDLKEFIVEIDEEMQTSEGDDLLQFGIINHCAIYLLREKMKLNMPKFSAMAQLAKDFND